MLQATVYMELLASRIVGESYTWNCWRVEYLAIHSKNAIGKIFNWQF